MIKVYEDWYVTVEDNPINYVVRRGQGTTTTGKDGKTRLDDKPEAFCGSLRQAVKYIRDEVTAERLAGARRSLGEALRTLSEIEAEFERIIGED